MATFDTNNINDLRRFFKSLNVFMIWLWRLGFRRWVNFWPSVSGRIMVIIHTGRKSGLQRRTPVNYAIMEGEIYCTAAIGTISDWHRNIQANPQVEVWLPDSWWAGIAEDISYNERRIPLLRQVIIASGIVGPLFGVNPHKMTEQEFDQASADYRLIHIRRTLQLKGRGGPGDLAWIWIPISAILLILLLLPRFIP